MMPVRRKFKLNKRTAPFRIDPILPKRSTFSLTTAKNNNSLPNAISALSWIGEGCICFYHPPPPLPSLPPDSKGARGTSPNDSFIDRLL
ncbi:hypothetical protein CDAR_568821 [Caerostris darwini]|uniref:Uncharacterized protein n=1 Tax=Caerostris darwini TaxID=1538125 RepID=A0AAV4MG18_9ARAC|nr:hypothetical protein CDAR_568821 [Caerostris darwini]